MEHKFDVETFDDLPPEFCVWRDEGCEVSDSCLNCPLPRCAYDAPRGALKLARDRRDREMVFQRRRGKSFAVIAASFGVSRRTVSRALRKYKGRDVYPNDSL